MNGTSECTIYPEDHSCKFFIGLDMVVVMLEATNNQYISTTGLIQKQFSTNKAQICYKQLPCFYDNLYTGSLNSVVKYICGFIGVTIYS